MGNFLLESFLRNFLGRGTMRENETHGNKETKL